MDTSAVGTQAEPSEPPERCDGDAGTVGAFGPTYLQRMIFAHQDHPPHGGPFVTCQETPCSRFTRASRVEHIDWHNTPDS